MQLGIIAPIMDHAASRHQRTGSEIQSTLHQQLTQKSAPLLLALLVVCTLLSGCVYQAPIAQGNLLNQDDVDQVEVGMTRSQVRFLLGTPMIDDPFHADQWDYVYYLKIGRGKTQQKRWISVRFDDDHVTEVLLDRELNPDL